eukprot:tig00020538_g10325.t1
MRCHPALLAGAVAVVGFAIYKTSQEEYEKTKKKRSEKESVLLKQLDSLEAALAECKRRMESISKDAVTPEKLNDLKAAQQAARKQIDSMRIQIVQREKEAGNEFPRARRKAQLLLQDADSLIGVLDKINSWIKELQDRLSFAARLTVPRHLTQKFSEYLKTISARGYFGTLSPASDEYRERFVKARQKFMEKFGGPSSSPEQGEAQETPSSTPIATDVPTFLESSSPTPMAQDASPTPKPQAAEPVDSSATLEGS